MQFEQAANTRTQEKEKTGAFAATVEAEAYVAASCRYTPGELHRYFMLVLFGLGLGIGTGIALLHNLLLG
jgi:hypothetical protein